MSSSADSTTTTAVAAALAVEDLEVAYTVRGIDRAVLRGVSFTVAPGETFGLVGESGSPRMPRCVTCPATARSSRAG